MRTSLVAAAFCAVLAFPGSCQTASKNWKDRAEYDLANRVLSESNAPEKLKLLLEWRRLYPASDFARDRQSWLVQAYDAAGQGDEAFATAREMLESDPSDLAAMLALCRWAPTLKQPPEGVAGLVKKAATELLTQLDQLQFTTRRQMSSFLDGIETGQPARTEQVSNKAREEQRARAERIARQALEWANGR